MPGSPDLVSICDKLGVETCEICFLFFFIKHHISTTWRKTYACHFIYNYSSCLRLRLPIKQLCISCCQKKRGKNVLRRSFVCSLHDRPSGWPVNSFAMSFVMVTVVTCETSSLIRANRQYQLRGSVVREMSICWAIWELKESSVKESSE